MASSSFFDFPVYRIPEIGEFPENISKTVIFLREDECSKMDLELLDKILASIKEKVETSTIVKLSKDQKVRLSSHLSTNQKAFILLFGIEPTAVGLQIADGYYQYIKLNKWTVIHCHNLAYLANEVNAKKALWRILKSSVLD